MRFMRVSTAIVIVSAVLVLTGCSYCSKPNRAEQEKINHILKTNRKAAIGLDISHYQGEVNWNKFGYVGDSIPISFVFIRATMGNNATDNHFETNWNGAGEKGLIRGAYHFYRPNENSLEQAANFIENVNLGPGDLPPVLDIETLPDPSVQTVASLRIGLQRFLDALEEHYGVKPIIYTSDNYYTTHLKEYGFDDYLLWVANYNCIQEPQNTNWNIWQFSSQAQVTSITELVDINVFNGKPKKLLDLIIE